MKSFILVMLAISVAALPAWAMSYTITDNADVEIDQASSHEEQAWNFTALAGWCGSCTVDSVTVKEDFTLILPGGTPSAPNFQSTFIQDTAPLSSQSALFFIFDAQTPTATETTTLTPGVDGFTLADVSSGGSLGEFATRVARNGGGFFLESIAVTVDVTAPEPASIALTGLGLIALAVIARRRAH
ncbi:MAG: PEP-CTERM sorting domain-containing protein [Terriglobales bacterium]